MKQIAVTVYGFSKMCRLCLKSDTSLSNIFWFSSDVGQIIANVIMACIPVKLDKFDELPNYICETCYIQLINTYQFVTQSTQSDKTLHRYLKQLHALNKRNVLENTVISENCEDESSIHCNDVITNNCIYTHENINGLIYNVENTVMNENISNQETEIDILNVASKNEDSKMSYFDSIFCKETVTNGGDATITLEETKIDLVDTKIDILDPKSQIVWRIVNSNEDLNLNDSNENGNEECDSFENENYLKHENTTLLFSFSNDVTENDHILPIISNNNKTFQCDACNETFTQSEDLNTHQFAHSTENTHQCDVCNKLFTQLSTLKEHKSAHTKDISYICDVCNKCFANSVSLKCHKRLHTGEKPYQCDVCDKSFVRADQVRQHKLIHTGEKPYQCDICNKCFAHLVSLKYHTLVHTGEKPYQCDICNKRFVRADKMKQHSTVHTGEKSYQCDICNKCFAHSVSLKYHKQLHTGDKSYQCDICNERFIRLDKLKQHSVVHTGKKSFCCDVCNKYFTHLSSINVHKRLHTGEKPYQCKICDKRFHRLDTMKTHVLTHTSEKQYVTLQ